MIRILAAVLIGLLFDGLTRAPMPPPTVEAVDAAETIIETVAETVVEAEKAEADEPVRLTEEERAAAVYIAKTLHGECKDCTKTEQAAVVWCILNRVDSELPWMPDDIVSVVTQPRQFAGYDEENPVLESLREISEDVMLRWKREKNGETDVGRVLPKEYMYFWGDKIHNYFRKECEATEYWDWSLPSPYET